jgi:hypothetical protein
MYLNKGNCNCLDACLRLREAREKGRKRRRRRNSIRDT